jgi:hypothetical protein
LCTEKKTPQSSISTARLVLSSSVGGLHRETEDLHDDELPQETEEKNRGQTTYVEPKESRGTTNKFCWTKEGREIHRSSFLVPRARSAAVAS